MDANAPSYRVIWEDFKDIIVTFPGSFFLAELSRHTREGRVKPAGNPASRYRQIAHFRFVAGAWSPAHPTAESLRCENQAQQIHFPSARLIPEACVSY